MRELGILLSSLDGEIFIDVALAADTYDMADIVYATKDPTGRPRAILISNTIEIDDLTLRLPLASAFINSCNGESAAVMASTR